jgi:hypothetical protein
MFEIHMESCTSCRSFSDGQRATWDALDAWNPGPVSLEFDRKLYARIEQHENSGWWMKLWHRSIWQPGFSGPVVPIAMACITGVIGVMLYLPVNRPAIEPQTPQIRMEGSDLEQLETTLEDIEMFKQLAPASSASS